MNLFELFTDVQRQLRERRMANDPGWAQLWQMVARAYGEGKISDAEHDTLLSAMA